MKKGKDRGEEMEETEPAEESKAKKGIMIRRVRKRNRKTTLKQIEITRGIEKLEIDVVSLEFRSKSWHHIPFHVFVYIYIYISRG